MKDSYYKTFESYWVRSYNDHSDHYYFSLEGQLFWIIMQIKNCLKHTVLFSLRHCSYLLLWFDNENFTIGSWVLEPLRGDFWVNLRFCGRTLLSIFFPLPACRCNGTSHCCHYLKPSPHTREYISFTMNPNRTLSCKLLLLFKYLVPVIYLFGGIVDISNIFITFSVLSKEFCT